MTNTWAVAALVLAAMTARAERTVGSFNDGWRFQRDAGGSWTLAEALSTTGAWQRVALPHDWAIAGPFESRGDANTGKLPWKGVGWYCKTFTVSDGEVGKRFFLDFDGVMASPEIYVNSAKVGGWDYGYLGFRVDATPFVKRGANVIAVRADTRQIHSRWYPGAGIYRKVVKTVCDPVHVAYQATCVTTPEVGAERACVSITSAVRNDSDRAANAEVIVALIDAVGKTVAEKKIGSVSLPLAGEAPVSAAFSLTSPKLWDIAAPNLYMARIVVRAKDSEDAETVRFGIRSFAFLPEDGFHLNGRRVQLQGINLHSDLGPLGMAFNASALRRQLALMKEMGANALRTSHNCMAPEVLDLCDEMGFFVWDECFDKWEATSGRRADQNLEEYVSRNLRGFARRDRNHPCVFVWSIGNELETSGGNPRNPGVSAVRCALFRDVVRGVDATRPVGMGCYSGAALQNGDFAPLDLIGWNYVEGYKRVHLKYPDKPTVYSESASAVSTYGYYPATLPESRHDFGWDAVAFDSYDRVVSIDLADTEMARMKRDRYVAGEFVWTGIDYLGEPYPCVPSFWTNTPPERLARSSAFGIADLTGIPKDRYYLYRSAWNRRAETVHLVPHWTWPDHVGKTLPVYVYTSGDAVELFVNGRSMGRREKGVAYDRPTNLASGKPAKASTSQSDHAPGCAADGDAETRWCASGPETNQWWQVDLGAPVAFRYLGLALEVDAATYGYAISASDNGSEWRPLFAKPLGASAPAAIDCPATCRYVRVSFTGLKSKMWASIREFTLSDRKPDNPYYDVCKDYRLLWPAVTYEPGELKAVAYRGGKRIGEDTVRTAGTPVRVQLTPESMALPADGETLAFVQVDVVDKDGIRDPWAMNRVRFTVSGPGEIVAVGNGNANGLDSFKDVSQHPLYFGKAVVVMRRAAGKTGAVVLTAACDGLMSASVVFNVR
jgi:beta-galactosidase